MQNDNLVQLLVVEDEEDIREIIVEFLSELDLQIHEASDGVEALEIARSRSLDLIITDIKMPRMGGLELLEEIKKDFPHIITMIITGYSDKDTILKALNLHAYDFIEKPIDENMITSKVNNVMQICQNKKLLQLALKEWLKSRFKNLDFAEFDKKPVIEQNKVLSTALDILKLKHLSLSQKKSS